ncbi:MAG: YIP1 family protein [Vampirovibrionales bacterium]|nr:YIP1 family protein [Vampirovibrionales bacterium]
MPTSFWQADNPLYRPYGDDAWLERIYDIWLTPFSAFKRLAMTIEAYPQSNVLLIEAFVIVFLISVLGPLLTFSSQGGTPSFLLFNMLLSTLLGIIVWGLSGLFLGMLAFALSGQACWKRLYILMAYALLPWLFLAPATMMKISAASFSAMGVLGSAVSVLVWLWSSALFCLAIQTALRLKGPQLIILLLLPLGFSLIWFCWLLGFANNLIRFLSM